MRRVLLTGMSGTGKSTLICALAAREYKAVDLDSDEWSEWVRVAGEVDASASATDPNSPWRNHDWLWQEDRIQHLLSVEDTDVLFVSGTAPNQGKFHAQFDHIILLSAPADVLLERLSTRTNNVYGTRPGELTRVLEHVRTVEPLLRRAASIEIDTSAPLNQVLETILNAVQS